MDTNLYNDVKGDFRIAWDAHHQWCYVDLMYQDWLRELPNRQAVIDSAYHDFEAEMQPSAASAPELIKCPKCGCTNWRCWDERSFDCWDKDGHHVGTKVVGYLSCRKCGHAWTDVSVDPGPDCECEED